VLGRHAVEQFLVPQNIVRHLVATVDNLRAGRWPWSCGPLKPAPGQSAIATQGEITTLSDGNCRALRAAGAGGAGHGREGTYWSYERLYPLYQQAYEDLGYPGKYFNDRLSR